MANTIKDLHYRYEVKPFRKTMSALVAAAGEYYGVRSIVLDEFVSDGEHCSYIVLTFRNGAIEARDASMDSLAVLIEEAARLLTGGYYCEVEAYLEKKSKAKSELERLWDKNENAGKLPEQGDRKKENQDGR